MPWSTPTLGELRRLNRDNIAAFLPGADASVPNSVLRVLSDSNAGLAALTLQYLDWLSRQLMVDTAEAEWLERFGQIWLGGRKAASFASGFATFTGLPGVVVPAGTRLASSGGLEYEVQEAVGIGSTAVTARLLAMEPGGASNQVAGAPLTITTAIPGVDAVAFVVSMAEGVDAENDDDLRVRILERIRRPPMGGSADDYVKWALAVPGVTRAWTSPKEMGIGTVTVRFMMDEVRADFAGFPTREDADMVLASINAVRPVTALDLFVEPPVPEEIDFTLDGLVPDDAATLFAIEAAVTVMLQEKAAPAFAENGVAQEAQTIYAAWVSEAISGVAGVSHFTLTMDDHPMPSPGHMGVLGSITLA